MSTGNRKISQFINLETASNEDLLAIVDVSEPNVDIRTKKITKANLLKALQVLLVSGVNIKTIKGISVLGSGDINVVGDTGPQGEKGDKGDKGDQGIQGVQGEKGDIGLTGPKGDTGEQGPQGIQGPKGDKGDKGDQGLQGVAGQDGVNGIDGVDGTDGREVEIQKGITHIQWRYVGDSVWVDLIALEELKGEDGADGINGTNGIDGSNGIDGQNGADGREVQLRATEDYIQWKYDTDTEWTNLISKADLVTGFGFITEETDPEFNAWLDTDPLSDKEDSLGNPIADDYVLSSKTDGTRSWVEMGGGASTFIDLTDTPANYTDQAGKLVAVNSGADGLEFIDAPAGVSFGLEGQIPFTNSTEDDFDYSEDILWDDTNKSLDIHGKVDLSEVDLNKLTKLTTITSSMSASSTPELIYIVPNENVVPSVIPAGTLTRQKYLMVFETGVNAGTRVMLVSTNDNLFAGKDFITWAQGSGITAITSGDRASIYDMEDFYLIKTLNLKVLGWSDFGNAMVNMGSLTLSGSLTQQGTAGIQSARLSVNPGSTPLYNEATNNYFWVKANLTANTLTQSALFTTRLQQTSTDITSGQEVSVIKGILNSANFARTGSDYVGVRITNAFESGATGTITHMPFFLADFKTGAQIDNLNVTNLYGFRITGIDSYNPAKVGTKYGMSIESDVTGLWLGAGKDSHIYYDGTNLRINPKVVGSGYLSVLGDIDAGANTIRTTGDIKGVHKTADGTSAVADGTYTVGIGGTSNGTITLKDGIITAIQEAI